MKILFPIGTLYPSQAGGPSNTVYWMAKALTEKGVAATLVTTSQGTDGKVDINSWLSTNYGRVIYLTARWALLPVTMMITSAQQARKHDCIHLNSLFYPPSLFVAFIAKLLKKPVIWSCRGNLDDQGMVYSTWKKTPVLWVIRWLFNGENYTFHSTSPAESARIRLMLGQNTKFIEIPNYIELPDVLHPPRENQSYLLFVGRIHPIKALDNLIQGLSQSSVFRSSNTLMKIAGDHHNPYGEELKKQVNDLGLGDRIQFLGRVEGRVKQELYANALFTVLPSHSENFGNVIVESLAQGTPVIASYGTPWEILSNEQAGFWTDNHPQALRETFDRALSLPPDTQSTYRKNALNLARNRFDIRKNIDVWINAYNSVQN